MVTETTASNVTTVPVRGVGWQSTWGRLSLGLRVTIMAQVKAILGHTSFMSHRPRLVYCTHVLEWAHTPRCFTCLLGCRLLALWLIVFTALVDSWLLSEYIGLWTADTSSLWWSLTCPVFSVLTFSEHCTECRAVVCSLGCGLSVT